MELVVRNQPGYINALVQDIKPLRSNREKIKGP